MSAHRRPSPFHPAATGSLERLQEAIAELYGADFAAHYLPLVLALPDPPIRTMTIFANTRVSHDFGLEVAETFLRSARTFLARAGLLEAT